MFGSREIMLKAINNIRYHNDHYIVCADFEDYVRAQ